MMMTFMHLVCSIFDLVILYIFINHTIGERKDISTPLYVLAFVADEIILTVFTLFSVLPSDTIQKFFTLGLSILLTFLVTFLHKGRLKHRLFVTFSFQFFAAFAEVIIGLIFSFLPEDLSSLLMSTEIYGAFSSKILLFLFINIIMLFYRRKMNSQSANYTALILLMPILSLLLMLAIPMQNNSNPTLFIVSCVTATGILIANIVNYFLLQNILKINELHEIESNLQTQIKYQTGNYHQLSTAYRDTRRLIHDTKKHFFYIKNCVENKKYEKISDYLQESIESMERTFISVNTGNLVIDSFVSNYTSLAAQSGIQFRTNIQIDPNAISIKDYHLSIILGNLLDNALAASLLVTPPLPRQISVEIFTSSHELLIHIENTMLEKNGKNQDDMEQLNHGYGTKNIQAITELYEGNYTHSIKNEIYHAIVSIPLGL